MSDGTPPESPLVFPVRMTAHGAARVQALLALSGETMERFIQRAIQREVETREAARDFRRALALDATPTRGHVSSTSLIMGAIASRPALPQPIDPLEPVPSKPIPGDELCP